MKKFLKGKLIQVCSKKLEIVFLLIGLYKGLFALVATQPHFFYGYQEEPLVLDENEIKNIIHFQSRMAFQQATTSFGPDGEVVPLFSRFGSIDFSPFLEIQPSYPSVNNNPLENYFLPTKYPKTISFIQNLQSQFGRNIGRIDCAGRYVAVNLLLGFQINLAETPFFARIDLPFSQISCDRINFISRTNQNSNLAKFLNTNFDDVLLENGYEKFSVDYLANGISDAVVSFGFQGKSFSENTKINYLWGNASVGLILPFSSFFQPRQNYFFYVPIGFGGNLGTKVKYEIGLNFDENFEVTFFGENNLLFKDKQYERPVLHKSLAFFNFFDPQQSHVKRGTFWQLGAMMFCKLFAEGLRFSLGYSYKSQEATTISLTDGGISSAATLVNARDVQTLDALGGTGVFVDDIVRYDRKNQSNYIINDYLLNQNPRLQRGYLHMLHFGFAYRPTKKISQWFDQTMFSIAYNIPIWGKACFAGGEVSSSFTLGLSFAI